MLKRLIEFYREPEYFLEVRRIAFPIIAQQFVFSSLNMIGVVLVGQKGEVAVASVGLAGQVAFLLNLVHFGIVSGSAMFTAQFWGRRDILNLKRVLGLCLIFTTTASLIFLALAQLFSSQILQIYSNDQAVITAGAEYLRIFAWTFVFYAVTFSFAFVMRSTGDVKIPTLIGITALVFSTVLSYCLIFGKLGLPEMGINGVAVSTLIARGLECAAMLLAVYLQKDSPVAATFSELFGLDWVFLKRVLPPMLPVILNELFWSLGITTYNAIYGNMGTNSIAAINITSTIEQLGFVVFVAVANSTAVLVGNRIGAGKEGEAFLYGGRSVGLGMAGGVLMGLIVALVKSPVLTLYNVAPEVIQNASNILTVVSFFMWIRISNMIIVVGILRAGGDTRFSLFLDGIIIWIVGVPLAALGAFAFHFPVYLVYLCVMSEEVTKFILGLYRYRSRKWINNLAGHVENPA